MVRLNAKRGSRNVGGLCVVFGLGISIYILLHAASVFLVASPRSAPKTKPLSDFMVKSIIRNVIPMEDGKLEVRNGCSVYVCKYVDP